MEKQLKYKNISEKIKNYDELVKNYERNYCSDIKPFHFKNISLNTLNKHRVKLCYDDPYMGDTTIPFFNPINNGIESLFIKVKGDIKPKYLYSSYSTLQEDILYGHFSKEKDYIVAVEGFTAYFYLYEMGYNVCAVNGNSISANQAYTLNKFNKRIIVGDNDMAGLQLCKCGSKLLKDKKTLLLSGNDNKSLNQLIESIKELI